MESRRKVGNASPSPGTPRAADKTPRELLRSDSMMSNRSDRDKGVNIQVIVRCRPPSEEEIKANLPVVISCNEKRREVAAAQNIANKQIDRTFTFDKVFGPTSTQKDLYDHAVSPIVDEVLDGYNCTIFAYGQTGTGKTYTMEGGARKKNGEFPSDSGVIPRAVKQIFETLETQNAEYNVKVTLIELYNEEITDLLAPEETQKYADDKSKKPLALMEDGKGGVLVRGLEEEIVSTANEIYKILEKGSAKRRTAETLLNKQSSRSHSIFSITIHIRECTHEGDEMIKSGKLNLVDLAGSENISRSGARDGRAREAGEINKSLLTLGRVINALVEHSGHVPYRESKLTRLLRDSLGGKTKTCVIATISPAAQNLEETINTLDYAHRAKNIKNKPEVNQKMMKSALIKDLYSEIDRLKQEVFAAREKNGIYIPKDRYLQDEEEKKAMAEKLERMELEFESRDKKQMELHELYKSEQLLTADLSNKLENTEKKLEETEQSLSAIEEKHRQAIAIIKEKKILISNLLKSEKALTGRAFELRQELENASSDVSKLFSKIERQDKIEVENRALIQKFQSQLTQQLDMMHKTLAASVTQQEKQLKHMEGDMQSFVSKKEEENKELQARLGKLESMYKSGVRQLDDLASQLDRNTESTFSDLKSKSSRNFYTFENYLKGVASEADALFKELQSSLHKQKEQLAAYAKQQFQAHSQSVETARSMSKITADFYAAMEVHVSELAQIMEEAQMVNDEKLIDLEKKFEECSANEERQLIEKVAELIADSNSRKKKMVQMAVNDLQESAARKNRKLQEEMSSIQNSTSSAKAQCSLHMARMESHYLGDSSAVESGKKDMEEVLHHCMERAETGAQQWRDAQASLFSLERDSATSMESIIRAGTEANQTLRAQVSTAALAAIHDAEVSNQEILLSIDHSLQLDRNAYGNINSKINPTCGKLRELNNGHRNKIVEIKDDTGRCLLDKYKVDEPSCTTPKRRLFNIPSIASIEELKTPAFDDLLKSFWDSKSEQPNGSGDAKIGGAHDAEQSARDSKLPPAPSIKA